MTWRDHAICHQNSGSSVMPLSSVAAQNRMGAGVRGLHIRPIELKDAQAYIAAFYRHHGLAADEIERLRAAGDALVAAIRSHDLGEAHLRAWQEARNG